ncbi:hypothetical protein SMD44_07211 [Streptomyces alboflavus]|uniref:Uncharacterized protein n=1 Tax=Streptomyces alboflavus TaxID=67267 RepID=A0A1Z1WMW9_9ACTN|nr:hypothetical protein SMD44_07211 [Streptomyces alboflavus]
MTAVRRGLAAPAVRVSLRPAGPRGAPRPASTSPADGHAARCTDPGAYQDQTSSVTNGRVGAKRRSTVSRAVRRVSRAESRAAASPWSP